ncbi:formate dehydrogenase accessory protein FdhE [Paracoccus sp. TK19116]|uniref:Formate dehydrogenase accessory protein FdhE n=1 Tax=Paracoccus albicereus TaxID=2922394 RepID=A0ABT1MSX9_9RHOB|nr:formate dehydrogenase accessory protein FdhE [Paracoccus albicereus]MCQ0971402.1 formate dehydrogenase accessory protein FdhE [Paracoccus albicereus]
MNTDLKPDPSVIGGVPKAPLAFLPEPGKLFADRAKRFAFLGQHSERLGPYLAFLGELTRVQARLVADLPAPSRIAPDRIAMARANRMPPIDRAALATDPALHETLLSLCRAAQSLTMPEPARLALAAILDGDLGDRHWLLSNILSDTVPEDSAAPHLFAAAAVQVHMARLSATLDADALVRIDTGVCPSCGGRPVSSSVMGAQGIENARYATCACCSTQWNEVRVKCLCCGSNAAISYRAAGTEDAVIKAEVCGDCQAWVKILYKVKNHSLDPVADDVGSLGLDLMMKETDFRRGAFNPYLTGY